MRPTENDLNLAILKLSMCRYFPAEPVQRALVMKELSEMIGTTDQLAWLVSTMVMKVHNWPGIGELRGLFCTRFKPADGIEANCSIGGYSADDIEGQRAQLPPPDHKLLVAGSPTEQPLSEEERQDIERLKAKIHLKATQDQIRSARRIDEKIIEPSSSG